MFLDEPDISARSRVKMLRSTLNILPALNALDGS
jgi:hypothetical protein